MQPWFSANILLHFDIHCPIKLERNSIMEHNILSFILAEAKSNRSDLCRLTGVLWNDSIFSLRNQRSLRKTGINMNSFLWESNSSCSGILDSLLLVSHVVWKSIKQRITIVQFGSNVDMNQNFGGVVAQVYSDFTYVPWMVVWGLTKDVFSHAYALNNVHADQSRLAGFLLTH